MHITISMAPPYPAAGTKSAIIRIKHADRELLNATAKAIGMSTSTLARLLLVKGCHAILEERGLELVPAQPKE